MLSSANPNVALHHYYIVCRPISFKKNLDKDGIAAVFKEVKNKFPKDGTVYDIFLDEEQAKLEASQFAAREIPNFFNGQYAKTHRLAKPILCLALEHPLNLTDKSESIFFIKGVKTVTTSYQTTVNDLQQWQESDWTILLDQEKYIQPVAGQQQEFEKEDSQKCLMM